MSTKIEWTDATWNPVRGCSIVSPGCTNCYAMRQAHRFNRPGGAYEGLTQKSKGGPVWTGKVRLVPKLLDQPLRWKTPRRIFVNSMSDLFHEDIPDEFIERTLDTMERTPQHIYQILTKRPERMRDFFTRCQHQRRNVWLGVSVERQQEADERIPLLLQTPAAVRWISAEPLIGPVNLIPFHKQTACDRCTQGVMDYGNPHLHGRCRCECHSGQARLDWVVAGGESGPGARPMHPDWARGLRDQCSAAGVAYFFKQWGAWLGAEQDGDPHHRPFIVNASDHPLHTTKRAAGRLLDGRTHDEYPATA